MDHNGIGSESAARRRVRDPKKFFVVKRNGKTYHRFFLIKPKPNIDINDLAERLVALDDVLEVYVTEGPAGFMVKARFHDDKEPDEVAKYIKKNVDSTYGTLVSYINFRK